jgi:hypothetical protein
MGEKKKNGEKSPHPQKKLEGSAAPVRLLPQYSRECAAVAFSSVQ